MVFTVTQQTVAVKHRIHGDLWQATNAFSDGNESESLCHQQEQAQAVLGGSKKDDDVRRQEILGEGAGSLAGMLCSTCGAHAADMLRDPRACDVIVEVAQGGSAGKEARVHTSANGLLNIPPPQSHVLCTLNGVHRKGIWLPLLLHKVGLLLLRYRAGLSLLRYSQIEQQQCCIIAGVLSAHHATGVTQVLQSIAEAAALDPPASAAVEGDTH